MEVPDCNKVPPVSALYQRNTGVAAEELEETLADGTCVPQCSEPFVDGAGGWGNTISSTVCEAVQVVAGSVADTV